MTLAAFDLTILGPAFLAGLLVTATHVPLGAQVLARGIVFIDLAIAQIAGCGVLLADRLGLEPEGIAVQIAALAAALGGALLLTWTERIWPEVQEAVIGVVFVLAATGGILLLAANVHGSERLRDLLVGQVLWVQPAQLGWAAAVYAVVLALWFGWGARLGRTGFYVLFAVAVTVSVQLVGLYLVFATLIVPPLATRRMARRRLAAAWGVGAAGYAAGLALSTALDLPSGPVIVWVLCAAGLVTYAALGATAANGRMTADSIVVSIRDVRFRWPREARDCLRIDALDVRAGERVFVRGASGSGKSTLLGLVAGILLPTSGSVSLLGRDWTAISPARRDALRADHVGYVFQQFNLLPYLGVLDNALLPCRFSGLRAERAGDERETARRLLARAGLGDELLRRRPSEISVGQQQRVAAVRALLGRPELVLADEPTSALDEDLRTGFMALLGEACAEAGSALLFVSHDSRLAHGFDRIVDMAAWSPASPVGAVA